MAPAADLRRLDGLRAIFAARDLHEAPHPAPFPPPTTTTPPHLSDKLGVYHLFPERCRVFGISFSCASQRISVEQAHIVFWLLLSPLVALSFALFVAMWWKLWAGPRWWRTRREDEAREEQLRQEARRLRREWLEEKKAARKERLRTLHPEELSSPVSEPGQGSKAQAHESGRASPSPDGQESAQIQARSPTRRGRYRRPPIFAWPAASAESEIAQLPSPSSPSDSATRPESSVSSSGSDTATMGHAAAHSSAPRALEEVAPSPIHSTCSAGSISSGQKLAGVVNDAQWRPADRQSSDGSTPASTCQTVIGGGSPMTTRSQPPRSRSTLATDVGGVLFEGQASQSSILEAAPHPPSSSQTSAKPRSSTYLVTDDGGSADMTSAATQATQNSDREATRGTANIGAPDTPHGSVSPSVNRSTTFPRSILASSSSRRRRSRLLVAFASRDSEVSMQNASSTDAASSSPGTPTSASRPTSWFAAGNRYSVDIQPSDIEAGRREGGGGGGVGVIGGAEGTQSRGRLRRLGLVLGSPHSALSRLRAAAAAAALMAGTNNPSAPPSPSTPVPARDADTQNEQRGIEDKGQDGSAPGEGAFPPSHSRDDAVEPSDQPAVPVATEPNGAVHADRAHVGPEARNQGDDCNGNDDGPAHGQDADAEAGHDGLTGDGGGRTRTSLQSPLLLLSADPMSYCMLSQPAHQGATSGDD